MEKTLITHGRKTKGKSFALKLLREIIERSGIDITTSGRTNEEAFLRAIFFKICEDITTLGIQAIGELCNRSHSSVIHSRKIFPDIQKESPQLMDLYYCLVLEISPDELTRTRLNETQKELKKCKEALKEMHRIINEPFFSIIDLKQELNKVCHKI